MGNQTGHHIQRLLMNINHRHTDVIGTKAWEEGKVRVVKGCDPV